MGHMIAHALIGNTSKRKGWIGQTDGTLPTYEGPIPVAEVQRRLFNWKAISVPTGNFIPVGVDQLGEPGVIMMEDGSLAKAVVTPGKKGIVRSDDFTEMGRHSSSYSDHDYNEWLIEKVGHALQGSMEIWAALTLKNGAQAAVEIALDETMHDETTGLNFFPFMLARTSLDGSLATSYSVHSRVLECDNQFPQVMAEARKTGRQYKVKHTAHSHRQDHTLGLREAMNIMDLQATQFQEFTRTLIGIKTTRKQWIDVLDIIEPPAPAGSSKVKVTKTENRREALDAIYKGEGEIGALSGGFGNNVFNGFQAVNTYQQREVSVRGTSRLERVYDRSIRGDLQSSDAQVLDAYARVLDMPELRELVLV